MRNITFIGSLNTQFAEAKKAPKTLKAKRTKANKYLLARKIDLKVSGGAMTSRESTQFVRDRVGNLDANNLLRKFLSPENKAREAKEGPINWYKEAKDRAKNSEKVSVPKSTPTPSNPSNAAPKLTPKTNTPLLQPKSGIGAKIGIGAVGLLGTAALGYGIYRKTRSDKGKKRK